MKFLVLGLLFLTISAKANPLMPVKERLRLHMWSYGLQDQPSVTSKKNAHKPMSEEIERALKKL